MKKLLLILTTIFIVGSVVYSCSKDDGDDGYSIVGVWKHYTLDRIWTFNSDKTYAMYVLVSDYEKRKPDYSGTYTFDGEYLCLDGGFKKKVEFSEDGDRIKFDGLAYYRYNNRVGGK